MLGIMIAPVFPLVNAVSPLTQIATQADVDISPVSFTLTVSQYFPRFLTVLQLTPHFFASFLVTQNLNARICLDSFHTTLISAHQLSAVSINLVEVSRCLLLAHENTDTELLERKMLELLPPEHNDDLGDIDFTNCVSIHLRDFRRIVHQELSVSYRDRVCITTSESQIKLSVGDKKTILTRERGEYVNINPQGVETRFEFSIHPTSFFNNLTDKSRRKELD
ncbi:hypothetical protein SDJN02_12520, partial [Cucurbita argyrosperma subsp. argyrosperma]